MHVSVHNSFPQQAQASPNAPRRRSRWPLLAALVLAPALAALAAGCQDTHGPAREKKAVEVVVTTPITGQVADYQDFTGRLDALKTVDVRARASGFIMEAPFKEGDMVRKDDLLFQIDRRPYEDALNQAKANLTLAEADENLQAKNAARARELIRGKSIAQEEYDLVLATYEKSKATVGAARAARDLAELNLEYTRVTAPLSGRISRRNVDPGNLVNADNTVLTTICEDNPLYAYFNVDERTYLDLVGSTSPGQGSLLAGAQFPVVMRLANEEQFTRTGKINFIDNRVTATTGTIRMRGVFENPTGALKPGLFVRIRLPIGSPYDALMIPDEALLSDQGRKYVYVVNEQDEVVYRPVKLGQEVQGLRVIKEGLSGGERVIVAGQQRVRPKAQVQVKVQDPPKAPDAPLARLLAGLAGGSDKPKAEGGKEKAVGGKR